MTATPVALSPTPRRSELRAAEPHRPELLALDAGEQYRFGFSMDACIGCHSCEVACGEQNGLPPEVTWRRVGEIEGRLSPDDVAGRLSPDDVAGRLSPDDHATTRRFQISMSCNHCIEPACLDGCPTNAYVKLPNGVVAHHADDCIGCRYCTWNCPYSVPVFQPDRRIVTKCDMCQPRLAEGRAPACVDACPTHAITIEKVDVAAWRADHESANAPHLPDAGITLSTTRIELPAGVPTDTLAASDWNLHPEHAHWPLVWLTLVSQLAVGLSVVAAGGSGPGPRIAAAAAAVAGLVGAVGHLGRPVAAWKALRNLRRSWLSREVASLSLHAAAAAAAVLVPGLVAPAALAGLVGVYCSACLYVVPGRPAWNTPLTIVRFFATAVALGFAASGHGAAAAGGLAVALTATAANWVRLRRVADRAWRGAVVLETEHFRGATAVRWVGAVAAGVAGLAGAPVPVVLAGAAISELIGRWLFFVTVVPLNMPGSFWRGAAGTNR